jgi:hypothetical protein
MFINNQCGVSGNVPRDLFLSLFVDKTSKASNVEVIATGHGVFHYAKEGFLRSGHISFVNSGLFCDFVNNVGFRHCTIFLVEFFGSKKLGWQIYVPHPELKMNIEKI